MAGTLALAGCTATEPDAATTTRTVVSTLPPLTTLTVTTGTTAASSSRSLPTTPAPTRSASSPAVSSAPVSSPAAAPTTALPAAVGGDCPYLDAEEAKYLTGQRPGPGEVTAAAPAPICVFVRSDGGWMAAVRVFRTPDAASAAAAVDARVPIAASSPADRPSGWTGGYLPLPSGTPEYPEARSVYGVSKGTSAVVAWTNQAQSIKSRRIVEAVIENLAL